MKLREKGKWNRKVLTVGIGAVGVLLLAAALLFSQITRRGYEVTTYSMGSYVAQQVVGGEEEEIARQAADAVARLEDLISWRIEGSDIEQLNLNAGGEFISLNSRTAEILELCLEVAAASGGAFDPTIAPLSRLWDFDENPHLPPAGLIKSLLPSVNFEHFSLLEDNTAALQKAGSALDLGAVGKGAACDEIIRLYKELGASRGIVAVGGSVGVMGAKPFGEPWLVALRNPKAQITAGDVSMGAISITEGFLSTSGRYEKQFTDQETGETYFHILDPRTGYPAGNDLDSVTVWSQSGALSDALSTACFVLGREEGAKLLEKMNAGGIFLTTSQGVYVTESMKDSLEIRISDYTLEGVL